ncbi:MAG: hypothetical protein HY531_03395 [Chloroflexi bacterium]|nr:hypothetical protein [Chloroflexota bacterium]
MTAQAPADRALQTADYILSRLTSYFGNRSNHFSAFIDGNVHADGWLPAEAYFALSTPQARKSTKVTFVRGKAQGSTRFDPDLELEINHEVHQLAVVPVLATADNPLADQMDKGLAEVFQWLGRLKARSMLYMVAFPAGIEDADWKAALAKAEQKYQTRALGQLQFVIPRPPRPMVRAAAALFLHASRVPKQAPPAPGRE